MRHEDLIRRYFDLKKRENWWTLTPHDALPPVYRTRRAGKVAGNLLLFTVGATGRGRATGLDGEIERIIRGEGQEVHRRPSTSGSLKEAKTYPGVDLAACRREDLESILKAVLAAARERARPV